MFSVLEDNGINKYNVIWGFRSLDRILLDNTATLRKQAKVLCGDILPYCYFFSFSYRKTQATTRANRKTARQANRKKAINFCLEVMP